MDTPLKPAKGRRAADPVPPFGYYSMARRQLEGARRIDLTYGGDARRKTDTCMQFLFGWSLEGYLKAYLAGQGVEQPALIRIGHNLEEALREAVARGLAFPWIGRVRLAVHHLHPGHRGLYYRYLPQNPDGTDKTFSLILPDLAFDALDALDEAVFLSIQEEINVDERRLGQAPTLAWRGVARPSEWRPRGP
ncbi:hypothetical protein [Belnapia moabensis]|uniref:hypothetical protein n=1 Tax=Belnapia moabensis TaxID=365533 RepID=UPI0005B82247|nr:hypothetical protein [Belnapia moabensis]